MWNYYFMLCARLPLQTGLRNTRAFASLVRSSHMLSEKQDLKPPRK